MKRAYRSVILAAAGAAACLPLLGACGDDPVDAGEDTLEVFDTAKPDIDYDASVIYVEDTEETTGTPDVEGVDSAGEADTVVGPSCDDGVDRPFYCPCENNAQCASGWCVAVDEDGVAARCSKLCNDSCPNGWDCRSIAGQGDVTFICQPPIDNLCEACTTDATCGVAGDRCVEFSDGQYCGRDCQNDGDSCPTNYECGEIENELGQIVAYQCVPVSGSCNCPPGTDYDNDPLHCGGCNEACEYDGGVAGCSGGECFLNGCQEGFVNLNEGDVGGDADGCEYACTWESFDDWPDGACSGSDCDQDCDGLDGSYARGVFVSTSGSPSGSGSHLDPLDTITAAIQVAQGDGTKDHVYIAAGTYNERVIVKEGVSLFGGYANDGSWVRDLSLYTTTITSSSGISSVRAMDIQGIQTIKTVVDGVTVIGGTNANPGGSSYAIWVKDCTSELELVRVTAIGGNGGAGASGDDGDPGVPGGDAGGGTDASSYDCQCNDYNSYAGFGGAGAPNACAVGRNAGGGDGGDAAEGGSCNTSGYWGHDSPGGVGGGSPENKGGDGDPGSNGQDGLGGGTAGSVNSSGFWMGLDGADGTTGENGLGGGGGGSGKTDKSNSLKCGLFNTYEYGGGGGSFGVFLVDSSPDIDDCALGHKSGGNGGRGGSGGSPGAGKSGKTGGNGSSDGTDGGPGGDGGDGGRGGHGGGGAGGVAYGLYLAGSSAPTCSDLTFSPAGAGGTGGIGGASSGNRGADGLYGDRNKSIPTCQ